MDEPGDTTVSEIEAALRRGVDLGLPSHALLDAWAVIGGFADRQASVLADILDSASRVDPARSSAVDVDPEAVAFAVVDGRGRLCAFGDRFAQWVGDPGDSVDCRDLARRAGSKGRAIGMVRTAERGVLAMLAVGADVARGWPLLIERLGRPPSSAEVFLVVFAPSRSRALVLDTAGAMGLSPLETRLVAALLVAPTLEAAA